MQMELIPKEIEAILPPFLGQEALDDPIVFLRLFDPCSRYTFLVLEARREPDGDLLLFGFCRSPLGPDGDEFGFASLRELETIRGPSGLGIERDLDFKPTPVRGLMIEVGYRGSSVPPATRYPKLIPAPMWCYDDPLPD
jgi:DUF2958 family protein